MAQSQYNDAIDTCNAAALACDRAVMACLQQDNAQSLKRSMALGLDCAQLSRTLASYMARDSELTHYLCKFGEEIGEACVDEFSKQQGDALKSATDACRRFTDACRNLAVKMPGARATQGSQPAAH